MAHERDYDIAFLFLPKMPYGKRLLLVGACVIAGVFFQMTEIPLLFYVGTAFVFIGALGMLARHIVNEPAVSGKREWETVTLDRWERVLELDRESRRWSRAFLSTSTGLGIVAGLGGIALIYLLGLFVLSLTRIRIFMIAWYLDAYMLFAALWLSGGVFAWRPTKLLLIVKTLLPWAEPLKQAVGPDAVVGPMLEIKRSAEGELPTGARYFVRWPDSKSGLMGLQIQLSLNAVQGRHYPYLYAVIVAEKGFGLQDNPLFIEARKSDDTVSFEDEPDVEVAVIRQRTSAGTGYHTKPNDQLRIIQKAARIARELA